MPLLWSFPISTSEYIFSHCMTVVTQTFNMLSSGLWANYLELLEYVISG